MPTTTLDEKAVDQLNSLLRGELAAVETYEQALRRLNGPGTELADQLVHFAAEHSRNADLMKARVEALGGHASLIRASELVRRNLDVFHPQPGGLAGLSERVRNSFDPRIILNRGRMVRGSAS